MSDKLMLLSMQKILHDIEEGIHIVDKNGITIIYNEQMAKIEGLEAEKTLGRYVLDSFPNLTEAKSTLMTVLKTGKELRLKKQSYVNLLGQKISTFNSNYPIYDGDKLIGALEIAFNHTNVEDMSSKIMELQEILIKPKKKKKNLFKKYTFDSIIGQENNFLRAVKIAKNASKSSSSVMIFGETGTGKELFAQSIHYASNRADKPFIAQNCAALPENLLEGILFGTAKGGFTGAVNRPGLFEQAEGGTLFLDEINSMDSSLQVKILRVLQESYVRRVGGLKDIPVDVRIIAASNKSIKELLASEEFRDDLFYRINVISVEIPPLRERINDIEILCKSFIEEFNKKLNKDVWLVNKNLIKIFKKYKWKGNIRELRNVIETSMNYMQDEHVLSKEHLPEYYTELFYDNTYIDESVNLDKGLKYYLETKEKNIIENALIKHNFNISKASNELMISRQNLQYKIKKLNIEIDKKQNILHK